MPVVEQVAGTSTVYSVATVCPVAGIASTVLSIIALQTVQCLDFEPGTVQVAGVSIVNSVAGV